MSLSYCHKCKHERSCVLRKILLKECEGINECIAGIDIGQIGCHPNILMYPENCPKYELKKKFKKEKS